MGARLLCVALACASLTALGACENMSAIDRRIEKTMRERTTLLGGDAVTPALKPDRPERLNARLVYDKTPDSTNPSAEQLEYGVSPEIDIKTRLSRLERYAAITDEGREVRLIDVWRIAQQTSREYLDAEEEYALAAIRLLIERHLWGPRFFNDTSLQLDAFPTDPAGGDYRATMNVINSLRATQRLPYGGELSAAAVVRATRQLINAAGENYTQSSAIILDARLPLLRGAGMIAQEDLIQAERNLIYAARNFENFRREFLVSIARDYFNLVLQLNSIKNQQLRLESVRLQEARTAAQVEAGRRNPFERRQFEQSVLQSENDLITERERYILALDRFKIRLGLPVTEVIRVVPVALELPEPDVTPDQAAQIALLYRLDLQNRRDQVDDFRRAVANAQNQLLPDLEISGGVTFNTPSNVDRGKLDFESDYTDYRAAAVLSLPLDRERERLNLRAAIIAQQRAERNLNRFEDEIVLESRQSVREIDRARFSIELQELSVISGELRLEELKIKEDVTDARDRLDAESDLLRARNNRDAAVRDLRIAILDYLLTTGQLRVGADGVFKPLRGMAPIPLESPQDVFPEPVDRAPEFQPDPVEIQLADEPVPDEDPPPPPQ